MTKLKNYEKRHKVSLSANDYFRKECLSEALSANLGIISCVRKLLSDEYNPHTKHNSGDPNLRDIQDIGV